MTTKLKIPMIAGWHINLVAEKLNEIIVAMTASGDLTGVSRVSVHSDFQTSGAIRALRAIHVSLGLPLRLNKSCDFNSCELIRVINNVIQALTTFPNSFWGSNGIINCSGIYYCEQEVIC